MTAVDTDAIDDHSVPGDGPISQRPPPLLMKYMYDSSACRYTERPLMLSKGCSMNVPRCEAWTCDAMPVSMTIIVAHGHATRGGGGAAGGVGGGTNPHLGPQSEQSVP